MCSSLYVCREIVDGRKLRFDVQKGCWDAGWESGSRAALAVLVWLVVPYRRGNLCMSAGRLG